MPITVLFFFFTFQFFAFPSPSSVEFLSRGDILYFRLHTLPSNPLRRVPCQRNTVLLTPKASRRTHVGWQFSAGRQKSQDKIFIIYPIFGVGSASVC